MAAKIMLVEDDTNLSDIYKARLEAEGFTIITANDGEAALALAVKEKPDLIVSDVMMPKISGFDMLDILRSTEGIKLTKVIMMTALGQAEDKTRAEKLGADRYLVKSQVTLEDVVRSVHEVLGDEPAEEPASQPEVKPPEPTPTPALAVDNTPTVTKVPVIIPPDDSTDTGTSDQSVPAKTDDDKDDSTKEEAETSNSQSAALSNINDFVSNQEADSSALESHQDKDDDEDNEPEGGTKVIEPLDASEKPKPQFDIEKALANEAAKENSTSNHSQNTDPLDVAPAAGSVITPAGEGTDRSDPNQVAL